MAGYLEAAQGSLADAEVKAFAAKVGPMMKEHSGTTSFVGYV